MKITWEKGGGRILYLAGRTAEKRLGMDGDWGFCKVYCELSKAKLVGRLRGKKTAKKRRGRVGKPEKLIQ